MTTLLVKSRVNSCLNSRTRSIKTIPTTVEVVAETVTVNLATFPFLVPSSLETLTMYLHVTN